MPKANQDGLTLSWTKRFNKNIRIVDLANLLEFHKQIKSIIFTGKRRLNNISNLI